ncbi:uncharacterized protein LOC124555179 isoform X1 [Schistocerca americana]|uniref:uncharacterized protein LOC124555179 isoform X1 n=2 Tax=Schistocerca americana TaxID=7009 RepID=UPI001F5007FC|nr:uncharacterized protein LOC124555179 isoform X1 [Schistocerca americana]
MTEPAGGSDKSFGTDVAGNAVSGRSEKSATLANLKALFQHQFDNEIITCVAASFGWNEWRSTKALKMLAGNQSEGVELGMDPLLHNKSESPVSSSHNEEIKPSSKNGFASNGNTQEVQQHTPGETSPRTATETNIQTEEFVSPEMKTDNRDKSAVKGFTCASIDVEMATRAYSTMSMKTNSPDSTDTYSQIKIETEACGSVGNEIKSGTDPKINIKHEKPNFMNCSPQIMVGCEHTPKDEQGKCAFCKFEQLLPGEESKNSDLDNYMMCELEADVQNRNLSTSSCLSEENLQKENCFSKNVCQVECGNGDCGYQAANCAEYVREGETPLNKSTESENSVNNCRQLEVTDVFKNREDSYCVSNIGEMSSVSGGEVHTNAKEVTSAPFEVSLLNKGDYNDQASCSTRISSSPLSGSVLLSSGYVDGIAVAVPPVTVACDTRITCGQDSICNDNEVVNQDGVLGEFVTLPFTQKNTHSKHTFDLENIDIIQEKTSDHVWSPLLAAETSDVSVEDKDAEDKVSGWLRDTEQSYSTDTAAVCHTVPVDEDHGEALCSRKVMDRVTDQSSSDVTESSIASLSSSNSSKDVREHNGVRKHTRCSKVDRLANIIIDGKKIMILMRGLPGSGKSTLARHLVRSTMGEEPHRFIHSTDNFFTVCGKGRYKFNPKFLHEAHTWNVKRVLADAVKGITPIIVDNTNLEASEMRPYATIAVRHGYRIEFLEPNTYWRYFVAECARRNTHGVPIQRVADMMHRFDRSITVAGLLGMYHLQLDASELIQPHVVTTRMPKHRRKKRKRNRLKRKIRKSLSEEKLMMDGDNILNLSKISDIVSCGTSYDSNCTIFSNVVGEKTNVFSKAVGETESSLLQKGESIVHENNQDSASPGTYTVDGLRSLKPVVAHLEGTEENVDNQQVERAAAVTEDLSNPGLDTRKVVDDLLNEEIGRECSASPDEYVLVKNSEFIFQKPHNIHKWLSERPPWVGNEKSSTLSNTLPSHVNEENTDNELSKTLENDNIQLNFNFDRQVNRLMEAMDHEETAELRSLDGRNCVKTEFEKTEHVIGDDCKRCSVDTTFPAHQSSDTSNKFVVTEKSKQNFSESVSRLEIDDKNEDSAKKSSNGNYKIWKCGEKLASAAQHTEPTAVNDQTTANAENNYVLWDLEHGNVWGGEDPKPSVNVRIEEDLCLPKPPRISRKKLPVKDFLKESLHNLSQNATRPVQELDQWDTVEDPLSSWENRKKNNNMSTDVRRSEDHSNASSKDSQGKFVPQPQRSLGCFSRSRKSASSVSQRQSPSEISDTAHKIRDMRPPRSLSAAGNYAVNDRSNWSKYCSSIEPTAWKSEQNLTPETILHQCKACPGTFEVTDGKTLVKDSIYTDCVTNTHYSDFLLLQQVNSSKEIPSDVKIIVGSCYAPITDKGSAVVQPAMSPHLRQSGKSVFDKSSMTEHEENFTKFSETEFKELLRAFPAVPIPHLQEIFQKCNRDINWTVDVLLELDYKGVEESPGIEMALEPCTLKISDKSENDLQIGVLPSVVTEKTDQQSSYSNTRHTSEECWQPSELKSWQYEKETDKTNATPTRLSPSRTIRKDKNISPTAKELKEHIEQNIVLNKNCYSEHTLRIRKMRHGELLDMGEVTTSSNKNNDTILQIEDCDEVSASHGVIGSSAKQNILELTASGAMLYPENAVTDAVVEHNNQNSDISSTNGDEATGISDSEAFVDIKLGEEFVSQLHELFGKSSYTTVCETSATVKLPLCLALQIHYYLMKHEEEQIKQQQDVMIKEDEELARKIQESYGRRSKDEKVPDLREIMDMEMALALYKADQTFSHHETKETLAIKLSKKILCEMFPTFRKEAILDVFSSTGNSFDNTLAVLIASTSEEEAKVAMSPEALSEHRSQLIEAAEETVKRGVETTSPLEDFDDITADGRGSNVLYIVERYREQAAHHYRRRSEYHMKAQEAFQKGMPSVAHYYSQLARLHKTHAQEASCRAATAISAAAPDSSSLDLHGLYVREAVCLLDSFLDAHIMRLKASGQSRRVLHVVTGRGNNSRGGQPRLRPAILQRLTQRSIKYEEVNEGLFRLVLSRNNDGKLVTIHLKRPPFTINLQL